VGEKKIVWFWLMNFYFLKMWKFVHKKMFFLAILYDLILFKIAYGVGICYFPQKLATKFLCWYMYNVKPQRNDRVYIIEPIFSAMEYYAINVFWWSKCVDLLTVEKKWYSRLTLEKKKIFMIDFWKKKWYHI
jgi:hypothetical protein